MKFSMIVVTTSCAPVHAFSAPGMKPHAAPKRAPAPMATGIAIQRRRSGDRGADRGRPEGAQEELALGADVEEPGLEAEPDRHAAEDERCRRRRS